MPKVWVDPVNVKPAPEGVTDEQEFETIKAEIAAMGLEEVRAIKLAMDLTSPLVIEQIAKLEAAPTSEPAVDAPEDAQEAPQSEAAAPATVDATGSPIPPLDASDPVFQAPPEATAPSQISPESASDEPPSQNDLKTVKARLSLVEEFLTNAFPGGNGLPKFDASV